MADRTSAALFGDIFNMLAEKPDKRSKEYAKRILPMTGEYDFNTYQMGCDDALLKLGLARKVDDDGIEYSDGDGGWES